MPRWLLSPATRRSEGAILTDSTSTSNVTLQNNTVWTVTGNSNVTTMTNGPSLIQFAPPTGDPQSAASYKTLTVTNYVGQGGSIVLNTFQDDDSSPTDRLVINGGTATGSTTLFSAQHGRATSALLPPATASKWSAQPMAPRQRRTPLRWATSWWQGRISICCSRGA